MNNQGFQVNPFRGNLSDGVQLHTPRFVNEHTEDHGGNLLGDALRVHNPPQLMLHNNYRVNFNTVKY